MLVDCLPATGSDILVPLIIGGIAIILGIAAVVVLGLRRRRSGAALALVLLLALGCGIGLAGAGAAPAQAACGSASQPIAPPTSGPTAEPTPDPTEAPGTTETNVTWYWKIHNLGDSTAIVERFWDGSDRNECVDESTPVLDTQRVGADAGEQGGSSAFVTIASGSCFLQPTTLEYKIYLEGDDANEDYIRVIAVSEIGRSDTRCIEEGESRLDCNTAGDSFAIIPTDDPGQWQDLTLAASEGDGDGDGASPGTGQSDRHLVHVKVHGLGDRTVVISRIWDEQNNCVLPTSPVSFPQRYNAVLADRGITMSFEADADGSCRLARSVLHWKAQLDGDSGFIEIKAYTGIGSHSECFSRGDTRLTCNTAGFDVDIDDPGSWQDITAR